MSTQHSRAEDLREEGNVHPIPQGSKPGETDIAFEPIGDTQPDSALIRIGLGIQDVTPETAAAVCHLRQAMDRNDEARDGLDVLFETLQDRPLPPEAMFHQTSDLAIFGGTMGLPIYRPHGCTDQRAHSDRRWFGSPDQIGLLREQGASMVDGPQWADDEGLVHTPDPNVVGRARVAEILAANDAWQIAIGEWEDRTGIADAKDKYDAAHSEMMDLWLPTARTPANTMGDFLAKASLLFDSAEDLTDQIACMEKNNGGLDLVEKSITLGLAQIVQRDAIMGEAPADVEAGFNRLADMDFEPWPADESRPLDPEQWAKEFATTGSHAIAQRFAYSLLIQSRPELLKTVREMDADQPDMVMELYDSLQHTTEFLDCLRNYTDTAATRLLAAAAAVEREKNAIQERAA